MSWYVKYLLSNSKEIKEHILNPLSNSFTDSSLGEHEEYSYSDADDISDFMTMKETPSPEEDDFFNDLIVVEKEVSELHRRGILTGRDLDLIETMSTDPTYDNLGTSLGKGRLSITYRFNTICNLISRSLGGMFTNQGYLDYIISKYKLNPEKIKILKQYIENNSKI